MEAVLFAVCYLVVAVLVFRSEGFDKNGNYKERGSDKEYSDPNSFKILLGRLAYAAIAPLIIAVPIAFILGY